VNNAKQDAIALLNKDHAMVEKMFEREKQLTKQTAAKVSFFNAIKAALEVHATIEEEIFYPGRQKGPLGECERRSARGL
jgi:hypothetical protein